MCRGRGWGRTGEGDRLMKVPYRSSSRGAGVTSYEVIQNETLGEVAIVLEFRDAKFRYLYDVRVPGAEHVAEMIRRARAGEGLSTYVNQHVRKKFSARVLL